MLSWELTVKGVSLTGKGDEAILKQHMTAFFSSRQCPGIAIRAAMNWAMLQARTKTPVISGFHSPLEQSVLKVLIAARSPVVVMLARPVGGAKLPSDWIEPLGRGRIVVVSAMAENKRLTAVLATARNRQVAELSEKVVVAYASPGGELASLYTEWESLGQACEKLVV